MSGFFPFARTNACKLFKLAGLSKTSRRPAPDEQTLLDQVQVRLLEPAQLPRFNELLEAITICKALNRLASAFITW